MQEQTKSTASDWQLLVDVQKKLRYPEEITVTSMRPDMLLLSRESKTIHIVELTVPWEDRLNISHKLKAAKYQDLQLADETCVKGWTTSLMPLEVGCRGFVATSTRNSAQVRSLPYHHKEGNKHHKCFRGVQFKMAVDEEK